MSPHCGAEDVPIAMLGLPRQPSDLHPEWSSEEGGQELALGCNNGEASEADDGFVPTGLHIEALFPPRQPSDIDIGWSEPPSENEAGQDLCDAVDQVKISSSQQTPENEEGQETAHGDSEHAPDKFSLTDSGIVVGADTSMVSGRPLRSLATWVVLTSSMGFLASAFNTITNRTGEVTSTFASRKRRTRKSLALLLCSTLGTFALVAYTLVHSSSDMVCPTSAAAVDVEVNDMTVREFVENQLWLNIVFLILIFPPTFYILQNCYTAYEVSNAVYALSAFYYTAFVMVMYCMQLNGWCDHVPWVSALGAVSAIVNRVVTAVLVYKRVHDLERAMMMPFGLHTMRIVAITSFLFVVAKYLQLTFLPEPTDLEWMLMTFMDWALVVAIWLFMFVALRAFWRAALFIKVKKMSHARDPQTVPSADTPQHTPTEVNSSFQQTWSPTFGTKLEGVDPELTIALRTCHIQVLGILLSWGSMAAFLTSWRISNGIHPLPKLTSYEAFLAFSSIPDSLDILFNLVAGVVFAGDFKLDRDALIAKEDVEADRKRKQDKFRKSLKPPSSKEWHAKVEALAGRGISLRALLTFYKGLGRHFMQHYDPEVSTTTDVVRQAIIPLSRAHGRSYAEVMMEGKITYPNAMVSHNWGNKFADLISAIVADAVGDDTYEWAWSMLRDKPDELWMLLNARGLLDSKVYWVCAFSVNQHASTCQSVHPTCTDSVLGWVHPTCSCSVTKYGNTCGALYEGRSIMCEMNKFDDMMALLSSRSKSFYHVVAVDRQMVLFSRAWVVAELALSFEIGLSEVTVPFNADVIKTHLNKVNTLRVQDMQAARQADVDYILSNISDKEAFNLQIRKVIMDKISAWATLDLGGKLKRVGRIARMGFWTSNLGWLEKAFPVTHAFKGFVSSDFDVQGSSSSSLGSAGISFDAGNGA